MRNGRHLTSLANLLRAVLSLLVVVPVAVASTWATVVVKRNVDPHRGPSTSQPPIRLLIRLEKLEPGFAETSREHLNAGTVKNDEAWVWSRDLLILWNEGVELFESGAAVQISKTWVKPAPNQTALERDGETSSTFNENEGSQTNLGMGWRTSLPPITVQPATPSMTTCLRGCPGTDPM